MIIHPLNDHSCLGPITDVVRGLVADRDPELTALARDLGTPTAAIRWMRSLPQRDDTGEPDDGPRVDECSPPQRLRLPAPDPNCVERAALYLILGELLAPGLLRRLATIDTPVGRHTLPVENNGPVVLDPRVPRNCAQAGVDVLAATPAPADLAGCSSWVCRVAAEPAHKLPGGLRRLRNAQVALAAATQGQPIQANLAEDVATVLALAAREAPQWGPAGVGVVDRVAQAVIDLERAVGGCAHRNATATRSGRYRPTLRVLGTVGRGVGTAVLAMYGVPPGTIDAVESQLKKSGVFGSRAKPAPPAHSIAALTSDALEARHLERAGDA